MLYFLVPVLLVLLLVAAFTLYGRWKFDEQRQAEQRLQHFIQHGELAIAARHTMAYLRYGLAVLLAILIGIGAAGPWKLLAILIGLLCMVRLLSLWQQPGGLLLTRDGLHAFGRYLPWQQVAAMDIFTTPYGNGLRLFGDKLSPNGGLLLRQRPLLTIWLNDVSEPVALSLCVNHQLAQHT